MKQIHVECLPDEMLVSKLGFSRKLITHHQGRSRIFNALSKVSNQLAMVDEDPDSGRSDYEKALQLIEKTEFIRHYVDKNNNTVVVLKGKLEDYIINVCRKYQINMEKFGLPDDAKNLHDVINERLQKFRKLTDNLIKQNNPEISQLKRLLR